ncbi:transposable element Tc1 transposase [Trichonephila clavipes]|nr:transposable element Tc1 transposase [Trichonephila clavipes]
MKTAGWSTRRVAGQMDGSECIVRNCWEQWTREGTHARKTGSGATRKTTRREDRRIVRQAFVDPTVARSTIRVDVGVAIVPQTISRHLKRNKILKPSAPFRVLPFYRNIGKLRLQWCQARPMWNFTDWQKKKVVFIDESRFVWGTDDNRVRVWEASCKIMLSSVFARVAQDFLSHFSDSSMACPLPRFVLVEHVWDQLKRQDAIVTLQCMILELAVQDLWAICLRIT